MIKILRRILPTVISIFVIVALIDLFDMYQTAFGTALYKICMATAGFIVAELIWSIGFRPYFGEFEGSFFHNSRGFQSLALGIFRGLLYASVIIACALGL